VSSGVVFATHHATRYNTTIYNILIFKGLTARGLYKAFGVKGLSQNRLLRTELHVAQAVVMTVFLHSQACRQRKHNCGSDLDILADLTYCS
jgi:hypothetical protein